MERKLIGVQPCERREQRRRLFDALEQALPVRFVGRREGEWHDLDALIVLEPDGGEAHARGLHRLVAIGSEPPPGGSPGRIDLSSDEALDPRLRGQSLHDARATALPALPTSSGRTLARCDGHPVWAVAGAREPTHLVSAAPRELRADESLRDRLADGRCFALLPLLHFLRAVAADIAWSPPPLRAAFLIDDPNLHWRSYGYLRFPDLVAHAEAHRYHVAIATVPLDGWFAHPAVTRLFRDCPSVLSLAMHGNDHVAGELAQPLPEARRRSLLAQALRRVSAFERRSRISVSRVMAAPHGVCSREMVQTMLDFGFEGISISRPYPWLALPPRPWLESPPGARPLAGWRSAELVGGGLPVLLRAPLGHSSGDLLLRAFLDQPLILCGHHNDLAGGLEPLAEAAGRINSLGEVRWASLAEIARSNFATRRVGRVLRVRMFSRRVRIHVPAGVEEILVEIPEGHVETEQETVSCEAGTGDRVLIRGMGAAATPIPVAGPGPQEISLARRAALDPNRVAAPPWDPWPLVRRFAVEGRDRVLPLARPGTRASGVHTVRPP